MSLLKEAFLEKQLYMINAHSDICHGSLFKYICKIETHFDMLNLRNEIAQTICNTFFSHDIRAISCSKIYLVYEGIRKEEAINDWQGYIVKLLIAYNNGIIEGNKFIYSVYVKYLMLTYAFEELSCKQLLKDFTTCMNHQW